MYARPFNNNYAEIRHLLLSKNEYGRFEVAIVMNDDTKYRYTLKIGHQVNNDTFDLIIQNRVKKSRLTYAAADLDFVKKEIEELLKHCELSN